MVNKVTGETLITDQRTGREYHLVFDQAAIVKAEGQCGGVSAMRLVSAPPTTDQLAALLVAGSEGWNRRNGGGQNPLSPNLAKKLIVGAGGYVRIIDAVQLCLAYGEGMGIFDGEAEAAAEAEDDADPPPTTSPTP